MIFLRNLSIKELIQKRINTSRLPMKKASIYFDGGAVPNPGKSACGIFVKEDRDTFQKRIGYGTYLGLGTNNQAEYKGLIQSLKYCRDQQITECEIFSDSKLVVEQINGRWKVKEPTLIELYKEAKEIMNEHSKIGKVKITWIRRDKNKEADEMCNLSIENEENTYKVFDTI